MHLLIAATALLERVRAIVGWSGRLSTLETQVRRGLAGALAVVAGLYEGQPTRTTVRPTGKSILRAFARAQMTLTRVQMGAAVTRHLTPLSPLHEQFLQHLRLPVSACTTLALNSSWVAWAYPRLEVSGRAVRRGIWMILRAPGRAGRRDARSEERSTGHLCCSAAGFTDAFRRQAEAHGQIRLATLDDLYPQDSEQALGSK